MPLYTYACDGCGTQVDTEIRADAGTAPCLVCDPNGNTTTRWQRKWGFSAIPPMREHFNHTLGKPISDMNKFKSELARKSDEASEQTGMEHNYQPLEYGDHKAFDASSEGIYESNVQRSRIGAPLLPMID